MEEKLFTPLREVSLPASGVDLGRAVRDGRRTVRRRRVAATVAAGIAAVTVLAAVPTLVDHAAGRGRADPAGPAVGSSPPPVSVAPMPDRAPAAFDPARQYADFGWLPDGLTDRSVLAGVDGLTVQAATPTSPTAKAAGTVADLRIVTAGHDIALDMARDYAVASGTAGPVGLEPAEPLNGRTARWNTAVAPVPDAAALRWEYAPSAWAEVAVQSVPPGTDPRALARRIALDVRYAVDRPVRLPVRFERLPAGLRPMLHRVGMSADGSWNVELSYGAGKRTKYGDWPLVVLVVPRRSTSGDNGVIGDPDSTIDGHPARRRSSLDGGASLQVYGVQGLYVELAAHDKATLRALGGNLDGLFRSATLHPRVEDWR
ncbi:hypothetical protein ACPFP2_18465 [Micromonospora citrea]|uniref:hypothetical protein n=1 Tax=Micromonospora citrea TaxID=47855 RepID=UPI003C445628